MKLKLFGVLCVLLSTLATAELYSNKLENTPEETRNLCIIFAHEPSMIDYESAENYVNAKIDEREELIAANEEAKEAFRKKAKETLEARRAAYARQNQQQSYIPEAEPVTTESPQTGSAGTYELTAYIATGNTCANGEYPTAGYTIASNTLPLGTRVYIEGIGERVVEDRGGMAGNVIDVFVSSYDEAIQFGRQTGEVYILED